MNFGGGGYQSVDSYGGGGGGGRFGGGGGYGGGGGGFGGGAGGGGYGGTSGGGGFIQGSQGFPSPGFGASPSAGGKGRGGGRSQAIRLVSAAQLHAAEDLGENAFKIDDKEIGMVSLVGEVMEVAENPTHIVYKIDDRTGPWVKVQRWLEDQESTNVSERSSCREGMYVRVIGHLKSFNKQKSVTAFCVRPIEDFNEVSHHLSEVMFAHLAATKGVPIPDQFQEQAKQASSGWGAPMATSTQMTPTRGGGGMYSGAHAQQHDSGLNPIQQQVLGVISSCHSDHGINIHELIKNMSQHGDVKVRTAVDFLCNEGHIYSTIDDDHYKSTDA